MDYEQALNYIIQNTGHSAESIAEILDLDVNELLDDSKYNPRRIARLKLFSSFLVRYNLL